MPGRRPRGLFRIPALCRHLGLAIHHSDTVVFERDEEEDLTHDVEAGVATGAMVGGYGGVAAASQEFDEHGALRHTPLEKGEVLVVACSHDRSELVEGASQRHGGRLIEPGTW